MSWVMQVKIVDEVREAGNRFKWLSVHPVGGEPYRYETREEAKAMLRMCYPGRGSDEVRVKEVP